MHPRHLFAAVLLLTMSVPLASADDVAKYPNWKGQWNLVIVPGLEGQAVKFDPTKPWGLGQQAPLTEEYKKVHEQSMADQAEGGLGNYPSAACRPGGMPRMMAVPGEYEFVIQPETTYILIGTDDPANRRIFTDGRPWPADVEPSYAGYSIGHWIDEGGTGTFNVLEAETRGPFKGPRAFDATGLPLAFDNESIFKERLYLDKTDSNIMHDMITVIDHALTRPWTADKTYHRNGKAYPNWLEAYCIDGNVHIVIGKENYFLSADGLLMPAKKNQAPPDLRYFKQSQK
jgi:hypothetical protein